MFLQKKGALQKATSPREHFVEKKAERTKEEILEFKKERPVLEGKIEGLMVVVTKHANRAKQAEQRVENGISLSHRILRRAKRAEQKNTALAECLEKLITKYQRKIERYDGVFASYVFAGEEFIKDLQNILANIDKPDGEQLVDRYRDALKRIQSGIPRKFITMTNRCLSLQDIYEIVEQALSGEQVERDDEGDKK